MRVELVKEFRFEAAHRLPYVPADHKCFRMHGHNYRLQVTLTGEIVDLPDLKGSARLRAMAAELPDRTDRTYLVPMSDEQSARYAEHEANVARLASIAQRRPLTQQELAQRLGCSVSLIFKIESDERRPSRQIAELLVRHLEEVESWIANHAGDPEAIARYVAQQRGLRVITHEVGLQPATAYFTEVIPQQYAAALEAAPPSIAEQPALTAAVDPLPTCR